MAIDISYGYAGDIFPGVPWARVQDGLGSRYWVEDAAAVKVTRVVGGTRHVSVAAGWFGGDGVMDHNDAAVQVQLPTVSSGTKYFLVVARRTWGTDVTSFAVIDCGLTPSVPGTMNTNRGVVADQPLAWVPLAANDTNPGIPIDVRSIGVGKNDFLLMDERGKDFYAWPGVRLRVGDVQLQRIVSASGTASWARDPGAGGRVALPAYTSGIGSGVGGWSAASLVTCLVDGNDVQIEFATRRTGAAIGSDVISPSTGAVSPNQLLFTFAERFCPRRPVIEGGIYITSSNTEVQGTYKLYPNGELYLIAGTAGTSIRQVPAAPSMSTSVEVTLKFKREDASA